MQVAAREVFQLRGKFEQKSERSFAFWEPRSTSYMKMNKNLFLIGIFTRMIVDTWIV